jgi:hypothetical protein
VSQASIGFNGPPRRRLSSYLMTFKSPKGSGTAQFSMVLLGAGSIEIEEVI